MAKGGKSYLVGERGPELFTPGVSGMVTPNHGLGGSTTVVVNVDASGSSVQGDEDDSRELGRLISVAVQSELIQQKRPGGLLA
jgi:phage-related minor tail protein